MSIISRESWKMLIINGLSKKFNNTQIIDQFNLKIKEGEITTIIGPSGGGKTTLLRCIAGLETIDLGEFLLDGIPFDPVKTAKNEQIIGIVFQDFRLFPNLSVLENITLAPQLSLKQTKKISEQHAKELLEKLGLVGKENLYPYQLSGGQKQRVALARALAMKPKILGYDEPTSALDIHLRQQIEAIILDLKKQGMTQIVVTHDRTFAKNISDTLITVHPIQ